MLLSTLAFITLYTAASSCHNPTTTPRGPGCLTASGTVATAGRTVASCDRTIKFGTKVKIDGKTYTVEDRTAHWVSKKFDNNCFDIFSSSTNKEALKWGVKKRIVSYEK